MTELLIVAAFTAAVFVLASAAQAVTGFGSALVAVPLLSLLVGPVPAVVATTAISLAMTAMAVRRERHHIDRTAVIRLSWAGLFGLPLGLAALMLLGDDLLTLLVAAVLLTMVGLLALKVRLPSGRGPQWVAGVASGALLTSTGMNGPPLVIVIDAMEVTPRQFRATLQGVFLVQGMLAVLGFVIIGAFDGTAAVMVAGGVLGIPLGWRLGDRLFRAIPAKTFRRVIFIGLVVTAVVAAGNALL